MWVQTKNFKETKKSFRIIEAAVTRKKGSRNETIGVVDLWPVRGLLCHNKKTEEKQNIYSGQRWQQHERWLSLGIDWGQQDQFGHQHQSL